MELSTEQVALAGAIALADPTATPWAVHTEAVAVSTELEGLGWKLVPIHSEPLPDRAHVRRGDPDTALAAADSIEDMGERHLATLAAARTFSVWGFTYEMLEHRYQQRRGDGFDLPEQTPQSIRSRCAELRRAGWIEDTGNTDLNAHGRPCKVWRAVPR